MKKNIKTVIRAFVSFAVLVFLDQWTKLMAVYHLAGKEPFVLLDGILEFRYLTNEGAAFSILQNQQLFFYILTTLVMLFVAWLYLFRIPSEKKYQPLNILCVGILAGACGNFIDRIRFRYVIDFIYFKLIDFPTFNVADCYITVSTAVLMILLLFYYKEEDLKGIF